MKLSERQGSLSRHSKSGDIIEPVLKPQWWVNCKPLAEEAIEVSCNVELYQRKV